MKVDGKVPSKRDLMRKKQMSIRHNVNLSAWEKWRRYGRFPFKFTYHIVALIFMTVQVTWFLKTQNDIARASKDVINDYSNFVRDPDDFPDSTQFFIPSALGLKRDVEGVVCAYFSLNETAVMELQGLRSRGSGNIAPVVITVNHLEWDFFEDSIPSSTYSVDQFYVPTCQNIPFFEGLTMTKLAAIRDIQVQFDFVAFAFTADQSVYLGTSCIQWRVIVNFDLSRGGQVLVSQEDSFFPCSRGTTRYTLFTVRLIVASLSALVSFLYQCLIIKKLILTTRVMKTLKVAKSRKASLFSPSTGALQQQQSYDYDYLVPDYSAENKFGDNKEDQFQLKKSTRCTCSLLCMKMTLRSHVRRIFQLCRRDKGVAATSLSWRERLYFIDHWKVITSAANILNIVHTLFEIFNHIRQEEQSGISDDVTTLLFSLAIIFSWVTILQFFKFTKSYYLYLHILSTAIGKLLRLFMVCAPVFLSYVFIGVSVFGSQCYKFSTIREAVTTLFSVMNGDSMRDTWNYLLDETKNLEWFINVYMFTFVFIFMYLVLHFIIALIEEAFFANILSVHIPGFKSNSNIPKHLRNLLRAMQRHEKEERRQNSGASMASSSSSSSSSEDDGTEDGESEDDDLDMHEYLEGDDTNESTLHE